MGKIYCVMGKSASGKDSLYRAILQARPSLRTYVMYTTRPRREHEEEGTAYHFTDQKRIEAYAAEGRLIESRTYDTVFGPWTYATVDDGQIDLACGDYLMPGTLESYLQLKRYFGAEALIPIYIEVEDGERLIRAVRREMEEPQPRYAEVCRRFLADAEDFSEERLREAGITKRYINDDFDRCLQTILADIKL